MLGALLLRGLRVGDDWEWPAVQTDVLRFARGAPVPPPELPAELAAPVAGGGGVATSAGPRPQWLLQKPRGGGEAEARAARQSAVQLAQALAAGGGGDLPDLGVWARQISRLASERPP